MNSVNVALFAWQVSSGLEIMEKVWEKAPWQIEDQFIFVQLIYAHSKMFEVEDIHVIDLIKKIYTTCFITLSYFFA